MRVGATAIMVMLWFVSVAAFAAKAERTTRKWVGMKSAVRVASRLSSIPTEQPRLPQRVRLLENIAPCVHQFLEQRRDATLLHVVEKYPSRPARARMSIIAPKHPRDPILVRIFNTNTGAYRGDIHLSHYKMGREITVEAVWRENRD